VLLKFSHSFFYVSNMKVNLDQLSYDPDNSLSEEVVKRFIVPVGGTGRNLTMNNWIMSCGLSVELLEQHNLIVVRKNEKDVVP
jgi:hypothetical protein